MSRSTKQALIGLGAMAVVLSVIAFLASTGNQRTGLRADVLSARRAEPGAPVAVTISVRDTLGRVTAVEVDFGDGRIERVDVSGEACGDPLTRSFDLTHSYDFTGFSTIVARVESGGCGAGVETAEAVRTIQVKPLR